MSERVSSLFVVSAPSGAGKSTVLRQVLSGLEGLRFSVSHTTRSPRPGEQDGVQYHFVSETEFQRLIDAGQFLEWAQVHRHRYGTSRGEYERAAAQGLDLLLDLDVQGAAQVRRQFPGAVTVFLLPPSFQALEARLRGRAQDDEATVRLRLRGALEEVRRYAEYDYVLVNDDLDDCAGALTSIVRVARLRAIFQRAAARRVLDSFPPDPMES